AEKIIPLKYELNKKIEKEEEKMKQSKVYTFREFPYCFFSAKTLPTSALFPLLKDKTLIK
ncbi:MAG: hypothetical protein U9R12_05875, partial [Candidatus Caldatribacteriota bacterium]|nr:hypothetical protein [Candidatus Caldatribacteriota bacterium]